MSKNALDHVIGVDDDGSGLTGTVVNDALIDAIQDAVDAAIGQVVQTKSGNYTVLVTDDVVICTASLTLSLYATSGNSGRPFTARNTSSADVTLDGNAAETIDGAATFTVLPGRAVMIRCDGSNWRVVANGDAANGQIRFPATQNASTDVNTLDDYEEGSWTPVIGGSGGQSGQAYSFQVGKYVKVGKLVTAYFNVQLSTLGTITGTAQIQGLPFASENVANQRAPMVITHFSALTTSAVFMGGFMDPNTTVASLSFTTAAATGAGAMAQADFANNTVLVGSVTYAASN